MNGHEETNRTYKGFSEALRELMGSKGYSFPKLAREIDQKLSITYLHNLATGKSKPTKENIETIAQGLKINPSYFKEYREYMAIERIEHNPEIADLVLDQRAVEVTSELTALTEEQQDKVVNLIKELKAQYRTGKKDR